ncbi:MAG TPA: MG2 domain-containing protein [Thermoanaerobaculia bacterium]|nr:MG2 domain-containing protein [Thermoanaerobaculia bacterium]
MIRKVALVIVLGMLFLASASAVPPQGSDYAALKAEAEKHYAEKSFSRAHDAYERAAKLKVDDAERRWIEFRLADTRWRADAASPNPDRTLVNEARIALEKLTTTEAPRDLVFAEARESLGDFFATHPNQRNVYEALRYYVEALDYWAGSSNLDYARRRYLDLVFKMAPDDVMHAVPRHVLVNAMQIAQSPEDRAHVRYLLARQLQNEGSEQSRERALELYDEIIALGRKSDFYDVALFHSAELIANDPDGDYADALRRYRALLAEFKSTETAHYGEAKEGIDALTKANVEVFVDGTYLPESEQQLTLHWRNVANIELAIHPVDLVRDTGYDERKEWVDLVDISARKPVRQWTYAAKSSGAYRPGTDRIRLEPRVDPGAYIVTAKAEGVTSRALLLITDAHILVHSAGSKMIVYVSDVESGEPIANARVHLWQQVRDKQLERSGQTDARGLVSFENDDDYGYAFVTAVAGTRQAYHRAYSYSYRRYANAEWRIYAFTDRPAYRPGETVQWKIIARERSGEAWRTPAGAAIDYEIISPRGEKISTGKATLNDFGTFWSEVPLTASNALGAYSVVFRTGDRHVGTAMLFRLEEYKLPEFRVSVTTPEKEQYRLGDTVEATIEANYYFGGPVANATVEAVIWQEPFYRLWYPWRTYDWYFENPRRYSSATVLRRETLQTDANGRAILRIDTQRDGSDVNYRIEARVVDASRREVRGEGRVRVTRQRYSVLVHPEHLIHRPNESVSVDFQALDANDKPVQVRGTVTVVRRAWKKRWIDRNGARIDTGRYEEEPVLETEQSTDANGELTVSFTPKRDGYYVIRWRSQDGTKARDLITAETAVWVAERATTDVGYVLDSGLDLIVDRETMRAGDSAAVMIVTPASGRWVVLSTAGDDLLDTQVLKLDGSVKLVQLPLDQRHVPNFNITASTVFDLDLSSDTERIVVPPVEQFLQVDVKADRELYQPRDEGTLTITTKNVDGKPVSAEVALAVADEAVTAIQADPAGDPRPFFYKDLRTEVIRASGSVQTQAYLFETKETAEIEGVEGGVVGGVEGGVVGGVVGGTVGGVPPPPPAVPAPASVAQAMEVTAEAQSFAMAAKDQRRDGEDKAANAAEPAAIDVQVRTDFRSTAFWKADIITDKSGTATVKVKYPEALTEWRATARAATTTSQFGIGTSTSRTNMPLIVRLQGPRFFVAGDRVMISAVMNNNTAEPLSVTPALDVEGVKLVGAASTPIVIPTQSEARADWWVLAEKEGPAKLRVSAKSSKYGDAMERAFTVYEHGIDKLIARSGKLRGDEAIVKLELPRERRALDLTVQVAPSLAVTMLDALPYLLEYPYGCTEQTMSRFLPAAMVARTVRKLGLDPDARLPKKRLQDVTNAGMTRLYDFQHSDGGWGWWRDGSSDDFMTAYVVWGFAIARDGGLDVRTNAVDRAANWLEQRLIANERDVNQLAWMLHALSSWRKGTPSRPALRAFDRVWESRASLSAYSRALAALAAHRWNDGERAKTYLRNLEDGVLIDSKPDQSVLLKGETAAETMATAHWGAANRFWWRWYEGPVETTAFALDALVTIDPQNKLVEPAMNWLVRNRRGAQWHNTRDTAIALLALNDYLQRSGELSGDAGYELTVNGKVIASKTLTPAEVLGAPSRFSIDPAITGSGDAEVRIRRIAGKAPLYFAAEARFVSLEEPIKAAGNELFVKREYFRVTPRPTLLKGVEYDRVPLRDGEPIASGDRVDVVLTIEAKNDYDYTLFEDLKPAGLEAVELQSGAAVYATGLKTERTAWVYRELRDRKVALFIDHLPQGLWEIRYTLRAEVPGTYHALPLLGQAMYVPEVRANGDEVRVEVRE